MKYPVVKVPDKNLYFEFPDRARFYEELILKHLGPRLIAPTIPKKPYKPYKSLTTKIQIGFWISLILIIVPILLLFVEIFLLAFTYNHILFCAWLFMLIIFFDKFKDARLYIYELDRYNDAIQKFKTDNEVYEIESKVYPNRLDLFTIKQDEYDNKENILKHSHGFQCEFKNNLEKFATNHQLFVANYFNEASFFSFVNPTYAPTKGFSEKDFAYKLRSYFGEQVHINTKIGYYYPDFIFCEKLYGIKLNIEIDEPYVLTTGEPTHFFEEAWNRHLDTSRDNYFLENKWCVIRFAEEQVIKYPDSCCKLITYLIYDLTSDDYLVSELHNYADLDLNYTIPFWTYWTANDMSNENYRESYLGIPNISIESKIQNRTNNYIGKQ